MLNITQNIYERLIQAQHDMQTIGAIAFTEKLFAACNGNMSCKLSHDYILITATGSAKGRLRPKDLSLIDHNGTLVLGAAISSETPVHLAIYQTTAAQAIIHTHPPKLLALDISSRVTEILQLPLYESKMWRDALTLAPALTPGSQELAQGVVHAIENKVAQNQNYQVQGAIWLKQHGLCTWAQSLDAALNLTEELEHLAEITLYAKSK